MNLDVFDLDRTLICGNSSFNFGLYLRQKGLLPFSVFWQSGLYYFRHHFLGMSLSELHHCIFARLLRGHPLSLIEDYAHRFVEEYLPEALYMPAFTRLKKAQQLGHYTMIFSNSPRFLVQYFAKALGVSEFRATEYALDEEKRFTKIAEVLEGKEKAKHLEKMMLKLGVLREKVSAYSDSILDLPFLQIAGKPIAVNPDRKLKAFSLKHKWRII